MMRRPDFRGHRFAIQEQLDSHRMFPPSICYAVLQILYFGIFYVVVFSLPTGPYCTVPVLWFQGDLIHPSGKLVQRNHEKPICPDVRLVALPAPETGGFLGVTLCETWSISAQNLAFVSATQTNLYQQVLVSVVCELELANFQ